MLNRLSCFLFSIFVSSISIHAQTCFKASVNSTKDASCEQACDGGASISVADGSGEFYFFWSTGDNGYNTNSVQGLCSGTYTVVVVDVGALSDAVGFDPNTPNVNLNINTDEECYFQELSITIDDQGDCSDLPDPDECGTDGCDCPIEVDVITYPATCSTTRDGLVRISVGGGSGFYTVRWSHGSTARELELPPGNHVATVTDTKGRTVQVDVPVGAYGKCFNSTEMPRIAELEELIWQIRVALEPTIGPLPFQEIPSNSVSCPFYFRIQLIAPKTAQADDGRVEVVIEHDDGELYETDIFGSSGVVADSKVSQGSYFGVSRHQDPTRCFPRFGFTLFATCSQETPQCRFDVELEPTLPPGCNGEVCNGAITLRFPTGVEPFQVQWTDPNGQSQVANSVADSRYVIIENICLDFAYHFDALDAQGCSGFTSVRFDEPAQSSQCCKVITGLEITSFEVCPGEEVQIILGGGDLYEWSGLDEPEKFSNYAALSADVSTTYSVFIYRRFCGVTDDERTSEHTIKLNVPEAPHFDIIPGDHTFCDENGQLDINAILLQEPPDLNFLYHRWHNADPNVFNDGRFSPTDQLQTTLDVRGLATYNGAFTLTYSRNGYDAVCQATKDFTINWIDELTKVVVETTVDVCGENPVVNLNNVISGTTSEDWRYTPNGPVIDDFTVSNFPVSGNQTLYVTVFTKSDCQKTEEVNIVYHGIELGAYTITKANCQSQSATVSLNPDFRYSWSPSDGLSCTQCPNPTISNIGASNTGYTVAYASDFCRGEIIIDPTEFLLEKDVKLDELSFTAVEQSNNQGCGWNFEANFDGYEDYIWDFGDGSDRISGFNPGIVHYFKNPGAYVVTLIAKTECRENRSVKTIFVEFENCECPQ